MSGDGKMSFIEHLEELRKRLIRCAVALLVGVIVCWCLRDQILSFLLYPLYKAWSQVEGLPELKPLNFSSMIEPFIAYMKLSAIGGLFVSSPFILYQLWKFIAPGLYRRERRLVLPFVLVSSLLFVGGSLMAYAFVFPIGFRFFLQFASGREMISLEAKVSVADDRGPDGGNLRSPFGPKEAGKEAAGKKIAPNDAPADRPAQKGGRGGVAAATDKTFAKEKWYDKVLGSIGRKDCAALGAALSDRRTATVSFKWHTARCGDPPDLRDLMRDGQFADLSWQKLRLSQTEYTTFTAKDADLVAGEHTYTLKVPADPNAQRLAPVLMIKDYLSLAMQLLLAFGLIFEVPVLISFLSLAGIVNYRHLLRFSRWFVVIAVIVGAVLTPPDVLSQILLAAPLILLYFLSILVAYFLGPKPTD